MTTAVSMLKAKRDLRHRMAYTMPELSLVLPFGRTIIEEKIRAGEFPAGKPAWKKGGKYAHKIWLRKDIEKWLEEGSGHVQAA